MKQNPCQRVGPRKIRGRLTKPLAPETYDVTIQPKGVSPIVLEDAFTMKSPEIDSADPTTGSAGDRITIRGYYFGTKKGKVTLGEKNCRVFRPFKFDP